MGLKAVKPYKELINQATELENDGELEKAASAYEDALKQHSLEELPYTRLMIIYRKLKDYQAELRIINKGLKAFQDHYDKKEEKQLEKHPGLEKLSKAFMKSTTGKSNTSYMYYPEPIPKWTLRKKTVEKKLGLS
jgi:tetratricopeptide (TPR) repeat protein